MEENISILHAMLKYAPIMLVKFVSRIVGWGQNLIFSDSAGEFQSQELAT